MYNEDRCDLRRWREIKDHEEEHGGKAGEKERLVDGA